MKRMIAPIVIVILIFGYLAFIASMFFIEPADDILVARIIVLVVVTAVAGGLIAVLWQRYKELKQGEEDDLGKY
jgi:formate hydrogenlyase subunit 3/multisubunit Na+/H+ antiporter MnhD subunit